MKKIMLFGIFLGFLVSNASSQSPQIPDKNQPVGIASPQTNLGYTQGGYAAQRSVIVAAPQQGVVGYQQSVVVADPQVVYQVAQPQVVAVRQVVVAAPNYGYGHCGNVATPYNNSFGGFGNNFGGIGNRFGGFNGFGGIGGFGGFEPQFGRGVNISAVDRRGTIVNASGVNRVRINRGAFGNIRSVRAF